MAILTVDTSTWVIDTEDTFLSLPEALQQARDNADPEDIIRFRDGLGTIAIEGSFINTSDTGHLLIDGDTNGDGVADITFTSPNADGRFIGSGFSISGDNAVEFRDLEFANMALRPVDARGAADADRNLAVIKSTGTDVALTRVTFTNIEVGDLDGTYADNHRGSDGGNGRGGISGFDGSTGRDGVNGAPGGWGGTGGDAVQARADAAPIIQSGGELTIRDVAFAGTGRAVGMDGGRGGDGGNGGRGGTAGDGGDGNITTRPGDGGNGGRAGNGGNGGDGGPGGWASNGIILLDGATLAGARRMAWDADLVDAGRAGEGGRAGTGGSAGTPGSGGQGGDGFLWFSDGANGIGGGTGAAGSRGAAGPDGRFNTNLLLESGSAGYSRFNTIVYVTEESRNLAEGESITLSVVRAGETGTDLDLPWQLQGALADDVDGPLSGSLRFFAGGSDVQTVTLTFRADTRLDPDADYTFLLGSGGQFGWSGNDSDASVGGLGTFETAIRVTDGTAATEGNDTIDGGAQNDSIDLLGGNDLFRGVTGNDTVHGGDGADTLIGGAGDDFLFGGATEADLRDVIFAGAGRDSVEGGHGNDELHGGGGNDTVLGGFGSDTVIGNAGDDLLAGGAGSDLMFGGPGNDTLNGGFGFDRLNGGDGADRFYHQGIFDHGSDWIQDYDAAGGDVLVFGQAGATRDQFQVNIANTPNAGAAGVAEAFVIYRPTGQVMWALVDGDGQSSINAQIGGQVFDLLA